MGMVYVDPKIFGNFSFPYLVRAMVLHPGSAAYVELRGTYARRTAALFLQEDGVDSVIAVPTLGDPGAVALDSQSVSFV